MSKKVKNYLDFVPIKNKNIKIPEYVYYIILIILIIYGILRNTNIPFGIYLRPTLV